MYSFKNLLIAVFLPLLLTSCALAQPSAELIPAGFSSEFAEVGDLNLHYVSGGEGEPLLLVHGFGSTWYEWRKVMPRLAERYNIIAVDLPGLGDSSLPEDELDNYTKLAAAETLFELTQQLGFESFNLVGHDIGLQVAFALASEHPEQVTKVALLDAPIPDESVYSFPSLTPQGPGAWQFGFFNLPELPELLIEGQEREFLEFFLSSASATPDAFTDADFTEYARTYSQPGKLHAAMNYFRAFHQDIERNSQLGASALPMPVLTVGGEFSLGGFIEQQVSSYAQEVQGEVVAGSGHWIPEEQPEALVELLLTFLD